ncbi:MAG: ABC transporter substrate-binding protein [Treponema sp.]|nr:ABC transporter substrate-binding protein [Treponema sp.]
MKKNLATAVLLSFATMVFFSCGSKNADTIKIGGIAPLSGPYTAYGLECKKGVDLAVEEINKAGGVLGKSIEYICEDDEGDGAKSVNAYKKLTTKDGVRMIIGSLTSGATISITSLSQANKVVQIAPAATAVEVTNAGNYIFRACYTDPFQGRVCGKFAAENLGSLTAAILYDVGNDYSVGLTENFINEYTANGGKVVAKESYSTGDKDFNAQITKIKQANPELVYLPDYYGTVALIAKQLRAQGITVPVVGADGWDGLTGNAGDEMIPGYYSNHYATDSDSKKVRSFVSSFKSKYNENPNAFAALGYDSMYMLRDAIQRAGTDEATAVRESLEKTDGDYVTGHLTFDEKHNPVKSAVMLKLSMGSNGQLETAYEVTVDIN